MRLPLPSSDCHLGILEIVLDILDQDSRMPGMAQKSKQPAFVNFHKHRGGVSLWVNRTLLPNMATALQKHQHPSLQDFSIACTQTYRGEMKTYENEDCSIHIAELDAIHQSDSDKKISGASITFRKTILEAASKALMGSKNRALGKIGLELRGLQK